MTRTSIALSLALVAGGAVAQQAEPVTLDAYSVWSATGTALAVGPHAQAFAGEMRGPYFIDVGEGAVPAGIIACIGTLTSDDRTGAQSGSAQCRLTASDGAVIFGRFDCDGFRLVGCSGRFEITGGEGRMAGATGEGPIVLRRMATGFAPLEGGGVSEAALGVVSWKGFTVTAAAPAQ